MSGNSKTACLFGPLCGWRYGAPNDRDFVFSRPDA
jgi:protein-disulfide isomerase-like protein with CxxC motif